jgi:hypothetical protein
MIWHPKVGKPNGSMPPAPSPVVTTCLASVNPLQKTIR